MGLVNVYSIHITVSAGCVQVFTVKRKGSVTKYISTQENATFEEAVQAS
jgi:hypothetical protein